MYQKKISVWLLPGRAALPEEQERKGLVLLKRSSEMFQSALPVGGFSSQPGQSGQGEFAPAAPQYPTLDAFPVRCAL